MSSNMSPRLPGSLKIHNGETKYLLKRAAARYFPGEMIAWPKEGFLMPVTEWVLADLEPWVRQTLSPERLALHGLFDQQRVNEIVDRLHQPGADYRAVNKVMVLVMFQEWYEHISVLMPESTDILPGHRAVPFSLSMLGWALNEEASIAAYIDRAGAFLAALTDDFELIVIDDGSTDRTWDIAERRGRVRG